MYTCKQTFLLLVMPLCHLSAELLTGTAYKNQNHTQWLVTRE